MLELYEMFLKLESFPLERPGLVLAGSIFSCLISGQEQRFPHVRCKFVLTSFLNMVCIRDHMVFHAKAIR